MWTYQSTTTNELYHHGIKGQKWGVRRYQNEDGSYTEAGKRKRNKDVISERKSDLKNRRNLSDEELNRKVKRLETEKRFKELSELDVNYGKRYTSEILKDSGKKIASGILVASGMAAFKYTKDHWPEIVAKFQKYAAAGVAYIAEKSN